MMATSGAIGGISVDELFRLSDEQARMVLFSKKKYKPDRIYLK
jgi:hypothetical protein